MALFRQMVECSECGKSISYLQLDGGVCENCHSSQKQKDNESERIMLQSVNKILLTTAHTLQDVTVTKYLGVVSAECAYGMNMFKDLEIPFLLWTSETLKKAYDISQVVNTNVAAQDAIFHSVLGLLNVIDGPYDPQRDIFQVR